MAMYSFSVHNPIPIPYQKYVRRMRIPLVFILSPASCIEEMLKIQSVLWFPVCKCCCFSAKVECNNKTFFFYMSCLCLVKCVSCLFSYSLAEEDWLKQRTLELEWKWYGCLVFCGISTLINIHTMKQITYPMQLNNKSANKTPSQECE